MAALFGIGARAMETRHSEKGKMENNIKIAVIGAGYWGKNLIRNLNALGALHTICDISTEALAKFKEQYPKVNLARNLEEVLSRDDVNALCISTTAKTHFDIARKGLLASKHIFVEKPLCLDQEEGQQLIELAAQKKLTLMVGHLLHYHPAVIALKKLVDDGVLGRLQYIYSNRLNLGKIRLEEDILWSFAPHDISLILTLTKQLPETVTALGSYFLNKNIADVTISTLTFPNGISAHMFVSWLHPFKEQKLVLVGTRGMAVFNDTEPEDKLLLYPHDILWKKGVPVPEKKDAVRIEYDKKEPLKEECAHFLDCVATGKKPITDGREGLQVLRVMSACQISMQHDGEVVKFTPQLKEPTEYKVHPSAIVDDNVALGRGTKVWHFSHILPNCTIGRNCNIGQNVVIGPDVCVGNGCKIQNNVSVYKGVTLEDNVFCGPSVVFTNVYNPRSEIRRMDELRPTLVRKGASIGANATIVCGNTLGRFSFIGAGAVVTTNVPDYALMVGNPARQVGYICRCGEKLLEGESQEFACQACGKRYGKHGPNLSPID